jgi:microcystin-dependent protein
MAYDLYPAVDETYNFAPEVRQALSKSMELRNTVVPMSTTARNNLTAGERWDGRVIANTTTRRVERYDLGTATWNELLEPSDLNEAGTLIQEYVDARMPSGVILPYPGTAAPSGWLLCNGLAYSRTTYAVLFGILGTRFGAGDGSTTFTLPDLRDRVPVGYNAVSVVFNVLGKTGGSESHLLTEDELPIHSHPGTGRAGNVSAGSGLTVAAVQGSGSANAWPTGDTGLNRAHNNLQPYIVLNYIIKT